MISLFEKKITVVKYGLIFFCFLLAIRIAYIKICFGNEYEKQAIQQSVSDNSSLLTPLRGEIVDRNHLVLAESYPIYTAILDPMQLSQCTPEERNETVETLHRLLSIPKEQLEQYIQLENGTALYQTYYLPIQKGISQETANAIEESGIKGVWLEKTEKRQYPFQSMAASVIGFLRGDNQWGLENSYQKQLKGQPGRIVTKMTGQQTTAIEYPPQNGYTLVTTLDMKIQEIAEKGVASAMEQFPCETASVLVMDPNTGEILAMASSSAFDPNQPDAVNDADKASFETMTGQEQSEYLNQMWKNFNISSTFEPGSIFKPMVVAAALDEKIITPETTFYCSGAKQVEDRLIHCNRRSGHFEETLEEVISNSCNVAMMDIVKEMGAETFYRYQKDFGFGEKTGVDLPFEESASSLLYTPDQLGPVELATSSFGQSFNCTPLQAITAFSALINGGNLMRPYVVSQILDEQGNVVEENMPIVKRKVISQETCQIMKQYLLSVVEEGTGKKAKIEGYAIGGKSGTGEQKNRADELYTISFIGFFPVENPSIVAMVVIDKPEEYADNVTTAAPAFRQVAQEILSYYAIAPAIETEIYYTLPNWTKKSIQEAVEELKSYAISYEIVGSGTTVINQFPKPGSNLDENSHVIFYTG